MRIGRLALAMPLLLLGAQHAAAPVLLQPLMKDVVAPRAQVVGDVSLDAVDDDGKPDAAKVSAEEWTKLASAGEAIGAAATRLAEAGAIKVAATGARLQNEETPGSPGAARVQATIDADRSGFIEQARRLAAISTELIQAARTRDAAKLMDASGKLDESCSACHGRYWYPDQGAK